MAIFFRVTKRNDIYDTSTNITRDHLVGRKTKFQMGKDNYLYWRVCIAMMDM